MKDMPTVKKLTELKREDIIQAAVSEFIANGFSATSMDRIAATAQVSKRTVYNHFENKEALFQVITKNICDTITQISEHPYDPNTSLANQLQVIAKQEMTLLNSAKFISMMKMITAESLSSPDLIKANVEEFQESGIGIVRWVKQASESGKLSTTDHVRAGKQFLALIEAFALWPQLYGNKAALTKKEQQQVIDSAVEMFLNTYAVD